MLDILKQLVKEELIGLFVDCTTVSETMKRDQVWETAVCRATMISHTATFSQQKKLTTEAMPIQGQMNLKPQLPNAQMSESVCDAILKM